MEPDFWRARWSEGRIGFHEGAPNAHLCKHVDVLAGARRVLVPLCGKTEDLAFLAAAGHEVVGVELVEDAVRAFFAEHGLSPAVTREGPLTRYAHGPFTLFAGDLFDATAARLGTFDGWYDRAALIALPPPLRARYVPHLLGLLRPGGRGLLVTVEYDQAKKAGPPFSVEEGEVRGLLPGVQVRLLDDVPADRFGELPSREKCFALELAGATAA
jgi:thiopurine S-methyltransferase